MFDIRPESFPSRDPYFCRRRLPITKMQAKKVAAAAFSVFVLSSLRFQSSYSFAAKLAMIAALSKWGLDRLRPNPDAKDWFEGTLKEELSSYGASMLSTITAFYTFLEKGAIELPEILLCPREYYDSLSEEERTERERFFPRFLYMARADPPLSEEKAKKLRLAQMALLVSLTVIAFISSRFSSGAVSPSLIFLQEAIKKREIARIGGEFFLAPVAETLFFSLVIPETVGQCTSSRTLDAFNSMEIANASFVVALLIARWVRRSQIITRRPFVVMWVPLLIFEMYSHTSKKSSFFHNRLATRYFSLGVEGFPLLLS